MQKKQRRKPLSVLKRHKRSADAPYSALAGLMLFFVLGVSVLFGSQLITQARYYSNTLATVINAVLVDLVNADRSAQGLGTLTPDPLLALAAQQKANDMAAKGYFAHTSPDGKEPWYWISQVGYQYETAGENLAVKFSDSQEVETAWMNSPTHRANLLNAKFTHVGIATAEGMYKGEPTVFVVQMFARPVPSVTHSTQTPVLEPEIVAPIVTEETSVENAPIVLGATAGSAPVVSKTIPVPKPAASTVDVASKPVVVSEAPTPTQNSQKSAPVPSLWQRIVASPWSYLRSMFFVCGVMIVSIAGYILALEIQQRHVRHSIYVVGIVSVTLFLFVVVDVFVFVPPIIS